MPRPSTCPCGTALPFERCCGPYLAGGEPPVPETLVRSRYTAFVRGEWPYLHRTLHPKHEDYAGATTWIADAASRSKTPLRYLRLRILDRSGGEEPRGPERTASMKDSKATVLFHVTVSRLRRDISFAERSQFLHDGVGWRYRSGDLLPGHVLPRPLENFDLDAFEALWSRR